MRVYCQNEGVRFCECVMFDFSKEAWLWLMVLPSHMLSFVDWSCIWWKSSGHSIVVPSWHLLCHCFATERRFLPEYFKTILCRPKPINVRASWNMKYVSRVQRLSNVAFSWFHSFGSEAHPTLIGTKLLWPQQPEGVKRLLISRKRLWALSDSVY